MAGGVSSFYLPEDRTQLGTQARRNVTDYQIERALDRPYQRGSTVPDTERRQHLQTCDLHSCMP